MATPILTEEDLKVKLDWVNDPAQRQARQDNLDRYMMYNGATRDIIERTIKREFKKPETISELIARLIPLNFPQKVIHKLANVYNESPIRSVGDENELDQELLDYLEETMELNSRMKEANRYFKLFKANLSEIVVDDNGCPKMRNLPKHTYEVFSHSATCPDIPDTYMKFLNFERDPNLQRFVWWTDVQHLLTDGSGRILAGEMAAMNNIEGINPLGTAPFIYTNSSTFSVNPIPDDDLLRLGVVIPLLLSDLAFATKYLSWAVVYTVGAGGDIPFSPNSVIDLDFGPNGETPIINTVQPNVQIQDVLDFVRELVLGLLSTKNLSTSTMPGQLQSSNASSGVAKALDSAESQEDKKDQQAYFLKAEQALWTKLRDNLIPAWRKQRLLAPDCNREFSKTLEVTVRYQEPKVIISEREILELSNLRLESGFTTKRRELQKLHPDFDEVELDKLEQEIEEEGLKKAGMMIGGSMRGTEHPDHAHKGTGLDVPAPGKPNRHWHEMEDGSGATSEAAYGEGHTHKGPSGETIV